jgi:hypothetical protein
VDPEKGKMERANKNSNKITSKNTGNIPRFRALLERQDPYSCMLQLYEHNRELQRWTNNTLA